MHPSRRTRASYDLHLHSYWSYDAFVCVEDHFRRARELHMECIAITEHHVLDSLAEVRQVARRYPEINAIPAAELTVNTSIGSVDLLCYGFPQDFPPALKRLLKTYHDWQCACGDALSKAMAALGLDFTDEHRLELLYSYRPAHIVQSQGNTHVRNGILADYFVARGFVSDKSDYGPFRKRLSEAYPFPKYPGVQDVVPVVHAAGAVVAIAHPVGYFKQNDTSRMDALRDECELDGIECAHTTIPAELTLLYRSYCIQHGLFSVGGSDCHTAEDIQKIFAAHLGEDEWLDELLERLQ